MSIYEAPVPVRDPNAIPTSDLVIGRMYRVRIQRCPSAEVFEADMVFNGIHAAWVPPVDCGEYGTMYGDGKRVPEWQWTIEDVPSVIGGAFLIEALIVVEKT